MEYNLNKIKIFATQSPVLKLLKNPDVLFFLHKEFIENRKDAIPEKELAEHWGFFRQSKPENDGKTNSDNLSIIQNWYKEDCLWVYKKRDPIANISKYEITQYTQQAFQIYESLNRESNKDFATPVDVYIDQMFNILQKLHDSNDPNIKNRIKSYDNQIKTHQEEIRKLQGKRKALLQGEKIEEITKDEAISLFSNIICLLNKLPTDSMLIANNLHDLNLQLKQEVQDDEKTIQEIWNDWGDGRKEIDESPEGKTFTRFMDFLFDDNKRRWMIGELKNCQNYKHIGTLAKRERPWLILEQVYKYIQKANKEISNIYLAFSEYINAADFEDNRGMRQLLREIRELLQQIKQTKGAKLPRLTTWEKPIRPETQIKIPIIEFANQNHQSILRISETKQRETVKINDYFVDEKKIKENIESCLDKGNNKLSQIIKEFPLAKTLKVEEVVEYLSTTGYKKKPVEENIEFYSRNRVHNVLEKFSLKDIEFERIDKNGEREYDNQ